MIKKIDHVVITTADIGKCIAFYEAVGFQVIKAEGRTELFAGDFKINVHQRGMELSPHAASVQVGSADLCFETDEEPDILFGRLKAAGIDAELGVSIRNGTKGKMKSLYYRDPDGNLIELSYYEV